MGSKKVGYHCDEVWTYGLANHIDGISPEFDIGISYEGLGPFEDFVTVQDGNVLITLMYGKIRQKMYTLHFIIFSFTQHVPFLKVLLANGMESV